MTHSTNSTETPSAIAGAGELACVFALLSATGLYALYAVCESWSHGHAFLAFLVLSILVCLGIGIAAHGLRHTVRQERVMATIAMVILVISLPISGFGTLLWGLFYIMQGHGFVPYM